MKNQVIYLIEVYRYNVNEEPSHYVLNAWNNKEDAIKQAEAMMETYKIDGFQIHKRDKRSTCDHIGWINKGEESRHYWVNEITLEK